MQIILKSLCFIETRIKNMCETAKKMDSLLMVDQKLVSIFSLINYNYLVDDLNLEYSDLKQRQQTQQEAETSTRGIIYQLKNCLITKPIGLIEGDVRMVLDSDATINNNHDKNSNMFNSDIILLEMNGKNSRQMEDWSRMKNENYSFKFSFFDNDDDDHHPQLRTINGGQIIMKSRLTPGSQYCLSNGTELTIFLDRLKLFDGVHEINNKSDCNNGGGGNNNCRRQISINVSHGSMNLFFDIDDDSFSFKPNNQSEHRFQFRIQSPCFTVQFSGLDRSNEASTAKTTKIADQECGKSNQSNNGSMVVAVADGDDDKPIKNEKPNPPAIQTGPAETAKDSNFSYHSMVKVENMDDTAKGVDSKTRGADTEKAKSNLNPIDDPDLNQIKPVNTDGKTTFTTVLSPFTDPPTPESKEGKDGLRPTQQPKALETETDNKTEIQQEEPEPSDQLQSMTLKSVKPDMDSIKKWIKSESVIIVNKINLKKLTSQSVITLDRCSSSLALPQTSPKPKVSVDATTTLSPEIDEFESEKRMRKKLAIHDIDKSMEYLKYLNHFVVKYKNMFHKDEINNRFNRYRKKLLKQLMKTIDSIEHYINHIHGLSSPPRGNGRKGCQLAPDDENYEDQSFFYKMIEKMMKLIMVMEHDVFHLISDEIMHCLNQIRDKFFR